MTLAYVHDVEVSYSWHQSVLGLVTFDMAREGRLIHGGFIAMRCGTDGLIAARNKTVQQFLDTGVEWLLWTDTDMGFEADTLERLLEVADPAERPIIGGLCFAQRERTLDGFGGYRCTANPTIFDWTTTAKNEKGFLGRAAYPINTMVRCAGTGSALILIHRSVFERIAKANGPTWYDRVPNPTTGQLISEDLSFCLRAGALNIPIFVHTGVRSTHHKGFWLGEPDYWQRAVAPPATEDVAVLVPVMRRPQNAAPFMQSLRASTGLAKVYALADAHDRDTVNAWRQAGAEVVERVSAPKIITHSSQPTEFQHATFAQKVNWGFKATSEPWVFLTGDDVRFHAGWLDHAQAVAGDRYHVIGTNDMVNPRVLRGEHATHLLMRRSYVDEQGGGWDGPGVVAHEGYRHWYVDDEIVTAAKHRAAFAMALGSLVEHRHPMFNNGIGDDEVYQLGQSRAKQDQAHFKERLQVAMSRFREERNAHTQTRSQGPEASESPPQAAEVGA